MSLCVHLQHDLEQDLLIQIYGLIERMIQHRYVFEFDGMKGRDWLMKWLPARAYDNAIYVIFSNPIGMDDDQLKNGCSMIY